jgi:hypothetical protein
MFMVDVHPSVVITRLVSWMCVCQVKCKNHTTTPHVYIHPSSHHSRVTRIKHDDDDDEMERNPSKQRKAKVVDFLCRVRLIFDW